MVLSLPIKCQQPSKKQSISTAEIMPAKTEVSKQQMVVNGGFWWFFVNKRWVLKRFFD
jgi:hypothetical protein